MTKKSPNRRPRIAILASIDTEGSATSFHTERIYVNQDYVKAVLKAGGVPLMLPLIGDDESIRQQLDGMDGLLLTGGHDVNPLLYGEDPIPQLEEISPNRDEYELKAIRIAYELGKPILAICRGLQIINVAFGGTLFQDIHHQASKEIQHSQELKGHIATHSVEVVPDTVLHWMSEATTVMVNSFHHQAIKELAPGFRVNARSSDGLIEGLEMTDPVWILGVQWHPERMIDHHHVMMRLFQTFIEASQNNQRNAS